MFPVFPVVPSMFLGRPSSDDTYYCSSQFPKRGLDGDCSSPCIRRADVEGTVIAAIKRYFRQPFLLLQITAALEQRRLEAPERAQHTEKERERLEGKRKRVVDMRAEDQITREDCATRLQAIDQELAKLPADPRPARPVSARSPGWCSSRSRGSGRSRSASRARRDDTRRRARRAVHSLRARC
jgi:hypothetical protein